MSALHKYETWIDNNPVSVITDHKGLDGWVSEHLDTRTGPRGRMGSLAWILFRIQPVSTVCTVSIMQW